MQSTESETQPLNRELSTDRAACSCMSDMQLLTFESCTRAWPLINHQEQHLTQRLPSSRTCTHGTSYCVIVNYRYYNLRHGVGEIKFAAVSLFGAHLRNCLMDLPEILYRDVGLSRTLRLVG